VGDKNASRPNKGECRRSQSWDGRAKGSGSDPAVRRDRRLVGFRSMQTTVGRRCDGLADRGHDRSSTPGFTGLSAENLARYRSSLPAGPETSPPRRPDQRREWPPSTRSLSSAKQWCRARGLAQPAKQRGPDDWQKPAAATDDWLNGRAGFRGKGRLAPRGQRWQGCLSTSRPCWRRIRLAPR